MTEQPTWAVSGHSNSSVGANTYGSDRERLKVDAMWLSNAGVKWRTLVGVQPANRPQNTITVTAA